VIKNILKKVVKEKRKTTNLVHLVKVLLVDVSAVDSVVAIVHGISTALVVTPTEKMQLETSLKQMESLMKYAVARFWSRLDHPW